MKLLVVLVLGNNLVMLVVVVSLWCEYLRLVLGGVWMLIVMVLKLELGRKLLLLILICSVMVVVKFRKVMLVI